LPKWGRTAVDHITADGVDEWITELQHLAPDTIKGIVKTLQIALGRSLEGVTFPSKVDVDEDPLGLRRLGVRRVLRHHLFDDLADDVAYQNMTLLNSRSLFRRNAESAIRHVS